MNYLGLLLVFVLEYVRPTSYIPALLVLHLNSLVPVLVALGTLFAPGKVTLRELFEQTSTRLLLFFMFLILLSMATADVTEYAFNSLKAILGYALMYWAIYTHGFSIARIKGICFTIVLVHLIVAGLNPIMFLQPEVRNYIGSGFFLGDGNDFALSVNIAIPLCLFLLQDEKKKLRKLVLVLSLLLLVVCVIATQSRGGTIALAAVAIYYWLKSTKKVMTAAMAAVALLTVLLFAPPEYYARMNQINTQEGSAQGRVLAWNAAVRMAMDNPLLGVGAGHFTVKYGAEYRVSRDIPWQTAHSIYFLMLGELGLPGIIYFISMFVTNFAANRRVSEQLKQGGATVYQREIVLLAASSAALLAFAVGGAFLSAVYYPHLYVLAGILGASRRVALEHVNAQSTAREAAEAAPTSRGLTMHWALRPKAAPTRPPVLPAPHRRIS